MNKIKLFLSSNSLINSAIWYTVGTFLLKGINFLTMPIFTALLGDTGYGTISMYTTWASIVSILVGMGISGTISAAAPNIDNKKDYNEYLSSTLFLATLNFCVIFIVFLIFKNPLCNLIGFSYNLVFLLIIQSFFNFVIDFVSNIYIFDKNHKSYLITSAIVTISNVAISVLLISSLNSDKYLGRVYGMAISTIFVGIILYIKVMLKGKLLISKKHWKFCIPIALPIILHTLSHLILNQADRIMLDFFCTKAEVGIYSVSYNIGMMINVLHMAINSAWVTWYFDKLKEKNSKAIADTAKKYIEVFTFITILFILASPEILKIMCYSSPEFWSADIQIPMIILGYYFVFLYTFSVNYEFFIKNTRYIALGSILASISNIILNMLLIPNLKGFGAALATALSYILLFLVHEFIVRKIYKHNDFSFKIYIKAIVIVVLIIVFHTIFIDNLLIRFLAGVIILIFGYLKLKTSFKDILSIKKSS